MPPKKGPKKPSPGDNVRQYLAREAEVQKAKHAVAEQQNLSAVAHFEAKGQKKVKATKLRRYNETAAAELESLNHEVTERRRACLKELYLADQEEYEKELNAIGLALVKERI